MLVYTPPKPADYIPVIDLAPSFSDGVEGASKVAW